MICQWADHGERAERELKQEFGGGQGGKPPEAESFIVHFHTKQWLKVKDLNENLPRV